MEANAIQIKSEIKTSNTNIGQCKNPIKNLVCKTSSIKLIDI